MSSIGGAGVEIYFHRNQVIDLRKKKNIYKLELCYFVDWYLITYTMHILLCSSALQKNFCRLNAALNAELPLIAVVTEVFSFLQKF